MTSSARRSAKSAATRRSSPDQVTPAKTASTMENVTKTRTAPARPSSSSVTRPPSTQASAASKKPAEKTAVPPRTTKVASPAKKATAKKTATKVTAAAKKVPAKKAPAKKAPAKKAPAKKTATKVTAAKKVPAKKVPAKKTSSVAKKATAKKPAEKVAVPSRAAAAAKRAADRALPPIPSTAAPVVVKKTTPTPKAAAPDAPTPLTSDQWNDKNRELFNERIRIAAEVEKLEAIIPEERTPKIRQQLKRMRYQHEAITYKIFDANKGLMLRYVRRFTQNASQEDIRDFEAAATVGLMRAITTYDPSKGRFAQWAFKPMQREVLRAVHSADHQNMNPGDFERRPDVLRALRKLQDGDESARPSMEAVAAEAGVTVEQAKRVLQAPRLDSIYTPVGDGTTTVGELLADETDVLEDNVITRMGIMDLQSYGLAELDPRELFVIIRRQGLDCEPKQRLNAIGTTLGLSREAVRQIEARARGKLAHPVVLRKLARQGRD
jgi:RNA polymerase sigma factor (sigma-70 family)